jgi:exodeoxyribonuclease VII small subunit
MVVGCSQDDGCRPDDFMPRSKPDAVAADPSTLSYEQALAELEQWVQRMDDGQLPLDQMLTAYQRASTLLAHCRAKLAAVEQQVRVLEDGQLKPLIHPNA